MSSKIVILSLVLAAATAIEIRQPLLLKQQVLLKQPIEIEEGPAEYEFAYAVHDEHTGDIKAQKETRKGDTVEGSYQLIDSDGYRRLVQYRADKHTGFEAIVHREPTNIKIPVPEPRQKLVATKLLAAPLVHYQQPLITNLIRSEQRSVEIGRSADGYDNHVTFSGPGVSYTY